MEVYYNTIIQYCTITVLGPTVAYKHNLERLASNEWVGAGIH